LLLERLDVPSIKRFKEAFDALHIFLSMCIREILALTFTTVKYGTGMPHVSMFLCNNVLRLNFPRVILSAFDGAILD
jgi:hypothetical protein